MSILIKPGDAWQEPEHIQSRNPDDVLQDVEVIRAKIGNEYIDVWPEYQPAVHYLMLYDGSLGQAGTSGANACLDATGGWQTNGTDYIKTFDMLATHIHMISNNRGGTGYIYTKKRINCSGYDKIGAVAYVDLKSGEYGIGSAGLGWVASDTNPTVGADSGVHTEWKISGIVRKNIVMLSSGDLPNENLKLILRLNCAAYSEENVYYAFLLKSDDWQTWLSKAGLSAASLADVMRDSTALTTLLSSHVATQYMLLQCTGDVMVSAIQSAAFKAALAASPYKDKIYANSHWAKFLAMV